MSSDDFTMMPLNAIKALTFDLYGTLVDWRTGWLSAAGKFMYKYQAVVNHEIFCDFWRVKTRELTSGQYRKYLVLLREGLETTFQHFDMNGDVNDADVLIDSWSEIKPFPDTNSALRKLRPKFKLAIISNTDNILIKRILPSIAVPFDVVMTSESSQAYKPTPKIYFDTLNLLHCSPSEAMHIARTQYDVFAAKSLGMNAAWVNRDMEELKKMEPKLDLIVANIEELARALEA